MGVPVAVDESANGAEWAKGDIYEVVEGQGVNVFEPEVGGGRKLVTTLPIPSNEADEARTVAVDDLNGDVIVGPNEGPVYIFEPIALMPGQYALVRTLTGIEPNSTFFEAVGVDQQTGEIYTSEHIRLETGNTVAVDQFSATGVALGRITGAETPAGTFYGAVESVTVEPVSHRVYVLTYNTNRFGPADEVVYVFSPDFHIPDVTTAPATEVKPESVTLNGTVNALEAETDEPATCRFTWGTSGALAKTSPCSKTPVTGNAFEQEPTPLERLQPDTTYYYRLQASNKQGKNNGEESPIQQFTTPGPGIRSESVSELTSTTAKLNAMIVPHKAPTSYHFEYDAAAYESDAAHGTSLPVSDVAIGSGETPVEVAPEFIDGLTPSTVYHYRVVAVSEVTFEVGSGKFETKVETFDGPDQTFNTQGTGGFVLPDGRAYEQVTPTDQHGALFLRLEQGQAFEPMQAAVAGNAIALSASQPSEAEPQAYGPGVSVLSTRTSGGWSSRVIAPPHAEPTGPRGAASEGSEYRLFSPDLSHAIVQPWGTTPLSPQASEPTAYLRTDYLNGNLNERCESSYLSPSSCFQPLVTAKEGYADDTASPFQPFGEEIEGHCPHGAWGERVACGPFFQAATPDLSHVILRSQFVPLTSTPGGTYYEWSAGKPADEQLQLVSVPPVGEAVNLILAGNANEGPEESTVEARHVISADGSRVLLAGGEGSGHRLYLRDTKPLGSGDPKAQTTVPIGAGVFEAASASDARIFFSTASEIDGVGDLREYDAETGHTTAVTEKAEVWDVLGASEEGSYLYFLANGVLAAGAEPGACHSNGGVVGACNLYVDHDGVTRLVAAGWTEPNRRARFAGLARWAAGWRSCRRGPDGL